MSFKFFVTGSVLLVSVLVWTGCGTTMARDTSSTGAEQPQLPYTPPSDQNGTQPDDGNTTAPVVNITNYMMDLNLSKQSYTSDAYGMVHYKISDIYTGEKIVPDAIGRITFHTDGAYVKFLLPDGTLSADTNLTERMRTSDGALAIKTMNNSGTTTIYADALLRGSDGALRTIHAQIPIVIERNRESSMSIVPYGTKYDREHGLYVESFIIQVVDRYGNKVKDGTRVNVGVVNNPILYSDAYDSAQNLIRHDRASIDTAKHFTLAQSAPDLSKIHASDKVVLLANQQSADPLNLGGWSIDTIDSSNQLTLFESYSGGGETHLSYVIGNDRRYNRCAQTLANASIYTPEGTEVKDGVLKVELRYGPYMVGKAVFVYANSVVDDRRIGISRRVDLLGTGLNNWTFTCANDSDENKTCSDNGIVTLKDAGTNARDVGFTLHCSGDGNITYLYMRPNCYGSVSITAAVPPHKKFTCSVGAPIAVERVENQ